MRKLLVNTKSKMTKAVNSENVPHLEIAEVVLVHYNIFNNDYQQDSRVLYTFVPNKSFGRLLDILPKKIYFKNFLIQSFNLLKYDQHSKPLEVEDKVNNTLVIN